MKRRAHNNRARALDAELRLCFLRASLARASDAPLGTMPRLTTKLVFVAVAVIILLVVAAITTHHTTPKPIPMARLQFSGYVLASNQVKVAVFLLTNPALVKVDYYAHKESGGAITLITNGTLASHSAVSFQIAPANMPTRFVVNCAVHRSLRGLSDEAYILLGLKTRPRSAEYTLFEELK